MLQNTKTPNAMKLSSILLLASCVVAAAETEEQINKRFTVEPGGNLVVDVDFGAVEVSANGTREVTVDVVRKISRRSKAAEQEFLRERPVTFEQDGNTIIIRSRAKAKIGGWRGWLGGFQRTEGKYAITVPKQFNAHLKTSGGGIGVSDLTGEVKAGTSGGRLTFARLRGPLDGGTSGGGIRVDDCQGTIKVNTSGGGIDLSGGAGSFDGATSGGSVSVKDFDGPVRVRTSGGGINIENVTGKVYGSTSGGSISARFDSILDDEVKLETSGGGVTARIPGDSAFDLDAATSGGGVSSDFSVTGATGKPRRDRLKGAINGGGKPVVLRSSGGSIHVKKM